MEGESLRVLSATGIALGVGLIIGLERGWKERRSDAHNPGLRSFAMVGLVGGIAGALWPAFGSAPILVAGLGVITFTALGYVLSARRFDTLGYTSEFAVLVCFLLGLLSGAGFGIEALAGAVATAVVLGFKAELHSLLRFLDERELQATLQLLVVAAVVLPFAPDRDLWGIANLNPRNVAILVLLILGVSYVGYFSVQLLGQRRGLLLAALFGGLASSTAVTLSFARLAAANPAHGLWLAVGINAACATMAVRTLLLAALIQPALLTYLWAPALILTVVPLGAVALSAARRQPPATSSTSADTMGLHNPLDLKSALVFAGAISVLFAIVPWVQQLLGDPGVVLVGALTGITDVDAINLSMTTSAGQSIEMPLAARVIVTAMASNTLAKAVLASVISRGVLWRTAGGALGTGAALVALYAMAAM